MARKARPRYKSGPKKGQFMSNRAIAAQRSGRKKRKRNPGRTVQRKSNPRRRSSRRSRPATTRRRRPARRNPPRRMDVVGQLIDGSVEAVQVLAGKAAVRSIPDIAGLPKQGNIGLAIQAAAALAVGFVARMFASEDTARALTAGGLTAPLETLIVAYNVPWFSRALSPVSANAGLSSYVHGSPRLAAYRTARPPLRNGLGAYVSPRGIPAGYLEAEAT